MSNSVFFSLLKEKNLLYLILSLSAALHTILSLNDAVLAPSL